MEYFFVPRKPYILRRWLLPLIAGCLFVWCLLSTNLLGYHNNNNLVDHMKCQTTIKRKSLVKHMQENVGSNLGKIHGTGPDADPRQLKTILIWTGLWRIHVPDGRQVFQEAGCEVTSCIITRNRSDLQKADAVLFHKSDLNPRDMISGKALPSVHRPGQIWVFVAHESPLHMFSRRIDLLNGIFNWTMTYKPESDIQWVYGRIEQLETWSAEKFRARPRMHNFTSLPFQHKNLVAWFVSNCKTQSKRELYVKELIKYVPVDVYGQCSQTVNYTCPYNEPKTWNKFSIARIMHDFYCHEMLEAKYKFYLSFENAFCPDYVTEKLFQIMEYDVIPVVMGLTNYSRILPENSFIDIHDFESPKKLAKFLQELGADEEKYNQYFHWKHNHRVVMSHEALNETFCKLCQSLHYPSQLLPKVYDQLDTWFRVDQCEADRMDVLRREGGW